MTGSVRKIVTCRLCGSRDINDFVDFGSVPLGNNLQTKVQDALAAEIYPLDLTKCDTCGHFQLGHAVDPNILYTTNYTYLSGIGTSFVRHFDEYAAWVVARCDLPLNPVMIDVGSNDGTCLKAFKQRGFAVCGVDPASLAAKIASENGIETINAFFDADAVAEIKRRHGQVDFVTSHNTLAHVQDLGATFRHVYSLLKDGGYFAFEVGYFREVLRGGYFDTIYHEHLDYHHATPLVRYLTALGLDVLDLSVNPVQGGSIRLLLHKTGKGNISDAAQTFLHAEGNSILNDAQFLMGWRHKIETSMAKLHDLVQNRVDKGLAVVGYGAPTKATLLMKMARIGAAEINYVAEDNPYKAGRFFPHSGIPIKASTELVVNPLDVLVIFAWNFVDDIIAKLVGRFPKSVEIIVPLPDVRTVIL
jgi:SAM-dependent methyltransferase